jgi:GxxExxY protein
VLSEGDGTTLCEKGIPFLAKPTTRRDLIYRGENIDTFEPDLVVADKIIPELKHQVEGFVTENEAQVLNYLKFWNMELGLLVNFALDKAVFERIPRQPRRRSWTRATSTLPVSFGLPTNRFCACHSGRIARNVSSHRAGLHGDDLPPRSVRRVSGTPA